MADDTRPAPRPAADLEAILARRRRGAGQRAREPQKRIEPRPATWTADSAQFENYRDHRRTTRWGSPGSRCSSRRSLRGRDRPAPRSKTGDKERIARRARRRDIQRARADLEVLRSGCGAPPCRAARSAPRGRQLPYEKGAAGASARPRRPVRFEGRGGRWRGPTTRGRSRVLACVAGETGRRVQRRAGTQRVRDAPCCSAFAPAAALWTGVFAVYGCYDVVPSRSPRPRAPAQLGARDPAPSARLAAAPRSCASSRSRRIRTGDRCERRIVDNEQSHARVSSPLGDASPGSSKERWGRGESRRHPGRDRCADLRAMPTPTSVAPRPISPRSARVRSHPHPGGRRGARARIGRWPGRFQQSEAELTLLRDACAS